MEVILVQTEAELEATLPVLVQLRPSYTEEALLEQVKKQQEMGYQLACVVKEGVVCSVVGFVMGYKLAWGKYLYIDDFITDEWYRSTGAGKLLLEWVKLYATEMGCEEIHLDSSVARHSAHRFYIREGFNIASHHFSFSSPEE